MIWVINDASLPQQQQLARTATLTNLQSQPPLFTTLDVVQKVKEFVILFLAPRAFGHHAPR
jgi:hypothetical protein